jgi:hypothetical protein
LNTTGGQPQLPFVEYTTVPSSGLNITGGQPQLSVIGNTTIPSIDSSAGVSNIKTSHDLYLLCLVPHREMIEREREHNNKIKCEGNLTN